MSETAEIGELSQEAEARIGNQVYEVGGARINLGWEKFAPKEPKPVSADEAVVVLPGWGAKINTKPVDVMGQAFADNSHMPTYAVTAEAEQLVDDSLYKEAAAVLQFLQEKGIKKVTLAGYSQDGSRAINLVVLLQERQKVDPVVEVRGLILMEPTGLIVIDRNQIVPPAVEEQVARRRQEVVSSKQTSEALSPQMDFREKFLIENVFTSSPSVRMIVPEKAAYHGLPLFRDVARAGLYMLDRGRRELEASQTQKTATF